MNLTKGVDDSDESVPAMESPDHIWLICAFAITAVAALLRFYDLALKPLHHDEGVNGFFLTSLFREGVYKYDPANYHGPTLYYISLAFTKGFGLETVPIRASVTVFGVLIVVMAFFLRRYIGNLGSLVAGLFLAISPGMVYISRYFIHEIFFVFLSFAIVISVVYFLEGRKAGFFAVGSTALILLVCFFPSTLNLANHLARTNTTALWAYRGAFFLAEVILTIFVLRMLLAWNDGRPIYLLLSSAFVALMFATKETAFITLGTMLIACACVWVWRRIYRPKISEETTDVLDDAHLNGRRLLDALGLGTDRVLICIAAAIVFIYLTVLFFSSFFTYPEGVRAAFDAYAIWTKTGSKDHTQNGFWAYVKWGFESEAPLMILSAVGALIAFLKARHRFAMFASLWAFGILAAYSIIPYKTPWIGISFILPMCLAGGYAINQLAASRHASLRTLAVLSAVGATAILSYQTYDHNFVRYDDEDTTYAYAHTRREFLDLMADVERYAEASGKGKQVKIDVVSPDYWPMVWYLKDYEHALFHARIIPAGDSEMIIAKKNDQDAEVIKMYSAKYVYIKTYPLRSGVDLVLLVRKDLAGENGRELYELDR